jgi:hypothetical protein
MVGNSKDIFGSVHWYFASIIGGNAPLNFLNPSLFNVCIVPPTVRVEVYTRSRAVFRANEAT